MMLVGRRDSIGGNFIARYDTNSHTLRYRSIQGRQIDIPNVRFPYGQGWVDAAVNAHDIAMQNKKLPPDQQIEGWKPGPVTWAIKDCGDAIQVKCMISLPADPHINSCYSNGCVAFDMNYDHFAVSETGSKGELLEHYVVPFQMEGRTSDQITNAISESLEKIFRHAASVNKPVAMEDIEHPDKCLLYGNKRANRKISEFAHSKVTYLAERKGQKYHLNVKKVNPAYTSQIGKLKYMRLLGLSVHESAAYVIGRRAMGLKDKVPKDMFHLVPEKVVRLHHWAHWAALYTALKKIPVSKFYRKINYHEYETPAALKKGADSNPNPPQKKELHRNPALVTSGLAPGIGRKAVARRMTALGTDESNTPAFPAAASLKRTRTRPRVRANRCGRFNRKKVNPPPNLLYWLYAPPQGEVYSIPEAPGFSRGEIHL